MEPLNDSMRVDRRTALKWVLAASAALQLPAPAFAQQTAKSVTAIGQANIAQQQVVQNRISENETTTNEQGFAQGIGNQKVLSSQPPGIDQTSRECVGSAAVAIQHWAGDESR